MHRTNVLLRAAALGCACVLSVHAADAADRGRQIWVETWAAAPQEPVDPILGGTPASFTDQTIRQIVRISAGGGSLRIRLTNEYGAAPVTVGAVQIALAGAGGVIVPGSARVVTFSGAPSVTIPAAAPALSDPIDYPVRGLAKLAVSLYLPGPTGPATPHSLGTQTGYIAAGDQTASITLSGASTTVARYFLSGVDVLEDAPGATIVTLGDSITDGYLSTLDANHRWPDYLAVRLQHSFGLRGLAVANEGISGNRVLLDGIGPNALSRLDRDVLSRPGLRYVTLLEGINDIGIPLVIPGSGAVATAPQIIAGYRQIIERAHERGVRVFGATLTPFQGAGYYSDSGEVTREAVNAFIRDAGAFDGVIDFDEAVRDPANPLRFLPEFDSGDHLHPSDAGYAAMANSIDLGLFTLPPYRP